MTVRYSRLHLWPWVLAGSFSGMAILTRATGLVLFGVVGLALILQIISDTRTGNTIGIAVRRAGLAGITWLAACIATIFLLLPALWAAPLATLNKLWSWSSNAATEGHENPTFFRGIHFDDPGLTVYPVVLLWRTSPVEWIGLILFLVLGYWAWRQRPEFSRASAKLLIVCTVFILVHVAGMSIGAKKFDRYILPVFPIIALFAAHGIVLAKHWLAQRKNLIWKRIGYSLIVLAVIIQALAWNSTRPYRLDYYNPVLGGASRAQNVLQMGWGQGGDQVVQFLIEQSAGATLTVQTSAVPSAFTYFLEDDSPIQFRRFSLRTPAGWYETDFYVAGIQQTQRGLAPGFDLLKGNAPVHSVMIGGVSYFDIYNVRNLPLPEELMTPTACNLTFDSSISLMQIVGREDTIDFYFMTTDERDNTAVTFDITLEWPDGSSSTETAILNPAPGGYISRLTIPYHRSEMPLNEATITLRASANSQSLAVTSPWLQGPSQEGETHSECFYSDPPT